MKTEILGTCGDWADVVNDCRSTVGKPPLSKQPSVEFKKAILLAEHSPIRDITIRWRWPGIKSWIATHWSRHKWECFIRTQRDDRTGVARDQLPQGAQVDFTGSANAQALIDTWRKRLCYQAHPETRAYAEDFKAALQAVQPELAHVLVPNCVYRGGCPEMKSCGYWQKLVNWTYETQCLTPLDQISIKDRYDVYNEYFNEKRK